MPIPKSAGAAIDETRQAWRDFVELFAVEGRLASLSLVRLIVFALLGGILLIISWLLLCVSLVDALHTAYAWEWKYVIAALAGSHLFAACLMLFSLRKIASRFFFPSTLAEIRPISRYRTTGTGTKGY